MKSNAPFVSFDVLLASLILLLFVPTLVSFEWVTVASRLLYSFTMLASLYLVSSNRRDFIIGMLLFIPSMATRWQLLPLAAEAELLAYCVFHCAFLGYVMKSAYVYLFSTRVVNRETIVASIILYLLFGFAMSLVYLAILVIAPGSFTSDLAVIAADPDSVAIAHQQLVYFSFVTQTTLGYGDISPINEMARTIVMVQAIMGQLYLAIVIARLVGVYIADSSR